MGFITITLEEYLGLKEDAEFLQRLYAAGVDNWEGFSEACQEDDEEDDIFEDDSE